MKHRTRRSRDLRLAYGAILTYALLAFPAAAADTPTLVKDIWPGSNSSAPAAITDIAGTAFLTADDGVNAREVWRSDGTDAGTTLVKDINPGGMSEVTKFAELGSVAIFAANDGATGKELWRSDGTPGGTSRVKDIRSGAGSSDPMFMVPFGANLYFFANDGMLGRELWRTDGTEAGTVLVKDVNPGPTGSAPVPWDVLNQELLFDANDGSTGEELWKTDGTENGTVQVKDIWPGPTSSDPHVMQKVGTLIFFATNDGIHGIELWKTDGTAAGTQLVEDINPSGDSFPPGVVRGFAGVGGTLFFKANDGTNGVELWKSDGTGAGTTLVKDINPTGDSMPGNLVDVQGTLFFSAQDATHGTELWKSDGTAAGTVMVKDIRAGGSSSPNNLTNASGTLYFSADDGPHGRELWKSDGTLEGTVLVADIDPAGSSNVTELSKVGDKLFFQAADGAAGHGAELWLLSLPTSGTTAHPTSVVITAGSLRSGGAADLVADDDVYFQVDSTTSVKKKTSWYGRIPDIPNEITGLKASYKGKNSSTCTQSLAIRNWTTRKWEILDKRKVGPTEIELADLVPAGPLADYVKGTSGNGEVWLRVQCSTRSTAFTASGDLMQIVYTAP